MGRDIDLSVLHRVAIGLVALYAALFVASLTTVGAASKELEATCGVRPVLPILTILVGALALLVGLVALRRRSERRRRLTVWVIGISLVWFVFGYQSLVTYRANQDCRACRIRCEPELSATPGRKE